LYFRELTTDEHDEMAMLSLILNRDSRQNFLWYCDCSFRCWPGYKWFLCYKCEITETGRIGDVSARYTCSLC